MYTYNKNLSIFVRRTSYLCLALIATCIIFYSIFGSSFAEINIQLSFLDFPIFVGELLMIFCVLVLIAHFFIEPIRLSRWHMWVLVYFAWVIFKAVEGYMLGGAYALRNAALFYYPAFAILVGYFLKKTDIAHNRALFLFGAIFLTAMAVIFIQMVFFIAALFVIMGISYKWVRWTFVGFLVTFFFIRFGSLSSGRGYLVGVVAGIFFLAWYGGQVLRASVWKQVILASILGVLFFMSLWIWGDRNAITTLIVPARIIADFRQNNEIVEQRKDTFVPFQLKTQVYHKNSENTLPAFKYSSQNKAPKALVLVSASPSKATPSQTVVPKLRQDSKDTFRNIGVAYINAVFRLFIWRDMIQEFIKYRPVFGFSFGHPQRSISLEILQWASIEWLRDGWITPHNSFLHLIYRGGIIGLIIIGFIIYSIVIMTRVFLRARSWRGGLLISFLIYWIVMAQFGVILELPYNAIVFWTLFGITWVYHGQLKEGGR